MPRMRSWTCSSSTAISNCSIAADVTRPHHTLLALGGIAHEIRPPIPARWSATCLVRATSSTGTRTDARRGATVQTGGTPSSGKPSAKHRICAVTCVAGRGSWVWWLNLVRGTYDGTVVPVRLQGTCDGDARWVLLVWHAGGLPGVQSVSRHANPGTHVREGLAQHARVLSIKSRQLNVRSSHGQTANGHPFGTS
jgi:hypothetical protein